jgi:hypothetical protein
MTENKAIVQTASSGVGIARPTIQSSDMIDSGWRMAQFAAQSSLIKTDNPFDAFFIIQYGWELGLTPMASLRTIYIVNGVPTCSGEAMLALIRRSGLCSKLEISGDATKAVVIMSRKDTNETFECTFTIEDANRAQLTSKAVWKQYPAKMLKWRAVSECAKFLFGDIIGGLYTVEEIVPHANINDAGELIDGDIVVDNSTPVPSKTIKPDFSGNDSKNTGSERGDDDNGDDTKVMPKWFEAEDGKNLRQILGWARDKGMAEKYIEAETLKTNSEKDAARKAADEQALTELLKLANVESWDKFETGKVAWTTLNTEYDKQLAELANRNADKSQGDEPAQKDDEAGDKIITLTPEHRAKVGDWLKDNFNRTLEEVTRELDDDLSRFSHSDKARTFLAGEAKRLGWSVIGTDCTYNGKGKFLEFHTVIGNMRYYSRDKFAELVGKEYAEANKIAELADGVLTKLAPLTLKWEDKTNYTIVVDAKDLYEIPY